MRKTIFIFLFLCFFAGTSFAFDLEKISRTAPGQLDYPGATALILKDYISYEYNNNGTVIQTEDEVVKVLNSAGVEKFDELNYVYDSATTELLVEEAAFLAPDGRISKAEVDDIAPGEHLAHFGSIRIKKIKFTGLSEGSIIEYKTKMIIKKPDIKDNFWGVSYFQNFEPMLESVLTAKVPYGKEFFYKSLGEYKVEPSVEKTRDTVVYKWKSFNNPIFVKEPAAPSIYSSVAQVRLSTLSSWDTVAKRYAEFMRFSKPVYLTINNTVTEITSGIKDEKEKIRVIHDYIVKNYRHIDIDFNRIGLAPRKVDEVIKYKAGNSQDLTALFVNMLRACNIKAYPALVGTRDYLKLNKDIVDPSQFNLGIAAVPLKDEYLFVDITSKYNSIDNIPSGIQGQTALVSVNGKAEFRDIPVKSADFNKENIVVEALVEKDGSIKEAVKARESGANSAMLRTFISEFDKLYQRLIIVLLARTIHPDASIMDAYLSDINKINDPYDISFIFKAPDFIDADSELMYFTLPMFPLQNLLDVAGEDPCERVNPVVISSTILSVKDINITLPDGFIPMGLPSPIEINNPVGFYKYSNSFRGGRITASSSLRIDKIEVSQEDYKYLRNLIEAAVATERGLIVLKNKSADKQ
ncbi:MAG: DUF3857 domain-containing protein [Armatimonadota bacterium]